MQKRYEMYVVPIFTFASKIVLDSGFGGGGVSPLPNGVQFNNAQKFTKVTKIRSQKWPNLITSIFKIWDILIFSQPVWVGRCGSDPAATTVAEPLLWRHVTDRSGGGRTRSISAGHCHSRAGTVWRAQLVTSSWPFTPGRSGQPFTPVGVTGTRHETDAPPTHVARPTSASQYGVGIRCSSS